MKKVCEICESIIPTSIVVDNKRRNLCNRRYCLTCSPFGKHNTKKLIGNKEDQKSLNSICINCESEFKFNRYVSNGKYCSNACQQEYLSKQYITKWLHGDITPSINMSNYIRNYLLKESGYACSLCGWNKINPYSNTYPLIIDHIDGNAENTIYSNLRVICPNCDSLTSTYKGLNKGNGRHARKQRYRDGKSY